jgi:hypothetical protein
MGTSHVSKQIRQPLPANKKSKKGMAILPKPACEQPQSECWVFSLRAGVPWGWGCRGSVGVFGVGIRHLIPHLPNWKVTATSHPKARATARQEQAQASKSS